MEKIPFHENNLYHKRSLEIAGILCIILGLLLLYSGEKLLAYCFCACGVVTIAYITIAKDSFEKVATSSEPTSSETEEY